MLYSLALTFEAIVTFESHERTPLCHLDTRSDHVSLKCIATEHEKNTASHKVQISVSCQVCLCHCSLAIYSYVICPVNL